MSNAIFKLPAVHNEPVKSYVKGSPEREDLVAMIRKMKSESPEIPMYIGGKKITSNEKKEIRPPHDHKHILGRYNKGNATHVKQAIQAALKAKPAWENMPWQDRAAIFLRAADLLAGPYRARMNAATMLGQSKNIYQAEIDSVVEYCDFLRFNAQFMLDIYQQQPISPAMTWNRMEYRALEGFVFALTPFNFTSIAGNLPCAPALMGNTVVWKPAETQIYSAAVIMEILVEAGLPDGVINLVFVEGQVAGDVIFYHPDFAGIHFTGSTGIFRKLWQTMGNNLGLYKSYPRIVGETGGKDFVVAHPSADAEAVSVALARGSFEYQGQKCSAASRAYLPASLWPAIKKKLVADLATMKMGSPENFENFINAVIDEKAFDKITAYITQAKKAKGVKIVAGGGFDKSKGYFIEPTVIQVNDPDYVTMRDELFGPVLSIYVYPDEDFKKVLSIVDSTSPYALTGAFFSTDRAAIALATDKLRHAAGNFYINDKPTGAVVGQQPFGGARASGTNDKAGSVLNLYRWVSARTIKENFDPPKDYRYPFMS
ncbi:MAG TPA: L-glutamate gamma-semialdehyde dehydrogenase [Saprospiraceae bacterium]|nr:L-glutamate gamma-semialdehyde dehydrogenase [Saprospiraceae bacterium]